MTLVNAAGELIQLISYEGSFTPNGGPASGLSSTDIGVEVSGDFFAIFLASIFSNSFDLLNK
jgi:hypothetical protein